MFIIIQTLMLKVPKPPYLCSRGKVNKYELKFVFYS